MLLAGCAPEREPRASEPVESPALRHPASAPASFVQSADAAASDASASPARRAIFRRFPALEASLPLTELTELPTAVEPARALGDVVGLRRLYLKRDDRAGVPYGGAKLRKLELFFGQARAQRQHALMTVGGVGSNQALATALHGRRLGFEVTLLLLPQAPSDLVRRHLLAEVAQGATLVALSEADENRALERRAKRAGAYPIPEGGTSPLGDLGFVNAGLELADQVSSGQVPLPDVIYLPLGTGGSAAGLALGLELAGLATRVVAVRVATQRYGTLAKLRAEAASAARLLHQLDPSVPSITLGPSRIEVREGYVGGGYAAVTQKGRAARSLAHAHGIELDETYSAKAFAALVDDAPGLADRVVVYWLTFDPRDAELGSAPSSALPPAFRGYFPPPK